MVTHYDMRTGQVIADQEAPGEQLQTRPEESLTPRLASVEEARQIEALAQIPGGLLGLPIECILSGQD